MGRGRRGIVIVAESESRLCVTFSIKKATTARTSSQVCSVRKLIACSATLQIRLVKESIRLGRSTGVFLPTYLRPFPKPLAMDFKAFVIVPTTAPITMPAASKMAVSVTFTLKGCRPVSLLDRCSKPVLD